MSPVKTDAPPPAAIPIRLRHVVERGGKTRLEPLVHCPRRGGSIDARRCVGCARMRSMQWDPEAGGEVVCAPAGPAITKQSGRGIDVAEAAARASLHDVAQKVTVCVAPDVTVGAARAIVTEQRLRCLPVVDETVRLVGVVTRGDLLRFHDKPETPVRDVMPVRAHALPEHAPVGYAVALMGLEQVSAVPVVTDEGELVGLWDSLDALRWVAERMGYVMHDRPARDR